jgi:hypothetical protein
MYSMRNDARRMKYPISSESDNRCGLGITMRGVFKDKILGNCFNHIKAKEVLCNSHLVK